MSVNRYWMPALLLVVLLGTAFGSQALGVWSVSGRTAVALDQLAPADIKGWMTLEQVANGLAISLEDVYRIGGIPADVAPETALKELEAVVEVSTLRELLAAYLEGDDASLPEETASEASPPIEPTALPTAAAPTSTPVAPPQHTGDGAGPTPLPAGQILPASEIKGRMTLREVSEQCAVDLAALLAALDLPSDTDPETQLKALTQGGLLDEINQVQEAVASLQG